jgi:hypothetical protein
VPDKIGRYRVVRHLGSGAFATVWLAEDDVLESPVAIKVLADNWAHQPDIRGRFTQEARIMRRADSNRVVRVLDIDELPDGRPYLVMTYAAGGTLADRLIAGPMPTQLAVRVAAEIAHAAAVLHEVGVLHRDLKPSNVLFHPAGGREQVLVADLGLAKAIAHASGFTVVAGTPAYMAPEQFRPGGGVDVRTDVYGIGAIAYEMLTGRPPAATRSDPPRPSKARPGVPAEVDDIVMRAINADPRRRWASATALATVLDLAADAMESPRPARRRRLLRTARRVVAAAAALALTSLIAGSGPARSAPPGWTRVGDASGTISIAVPAAWARQLRDAGWNPVSVRLPAGRAPGFTVGPDLDAWPDPASNVPGVFAGASEALGVGVDTAALPGHEPCARQADRQVTVYGLTGDVRRWIGCAGTAISFSEVLLAVPGNRYGVYVQIKQVERADRTDEILRTLRVVPLRYS